jgi:hypothetical protein
MNWENLTRHISSDLDITVQAALSDSRSSVEACRCRPELPALNLDIVRQADGILDIDAPMTHGALVRLTLCVPWSRP